MKILFLQKDIFAKPGVMAISAVLKQEGHQCDLLIDDLEKNIIKQALEINPDIIAFSITSIEATWMNKVGEEIRKDFKGYMICGGAHPTFLPEEIAKEEYLDAFCVGEGEGAIKDLVQAIETGSDTTRIANFTIRKEGQLFQNGLRPLNEDLDSLPFLDRNIYNKYKLYQTSHGGILSHYVILTGRGCPFNCSYCHNKAYNEMYRGKGKMVRRRSVENIIEELEDIKRRNPKLIVFEDDAFTISGKEWLNDFLEKYRDKIGIPFKIQTPANQIDEDLMAKLKTANCYALKMGIESGNERFRKNMLRKNVSDTDIINTARLAKKYGVKLQTFNMAGCPGETLGMTFQTYELNRKIRPDFVWCSLFHPHPGTDLYDYASAHGYIDDQTYNIWTVGDSVFHYTPMSMMNRTEIANLQKLMYLSILLRLPEKLLAIIIRFPLKRTYGLLFGIAFFIGLYRTTKTSFYDLTKLSFTHFLQYFRSD